MFLNFANAKIDLQRFSIKSTTIRVAGRGPATGFRIFHCGTFDHNLQSVNQFNMMNEITKGLPDKKSFQF